MARDDNKNTSNSSVRCSFCGKSQSAVQRLIAGPGVYICDECVVLKNIIVLKPACFTPLNMLMIVIVIH